MPLLGLPEVCILRQALIRAIRPLTYRDDIAIVPGHLHLKWPEQQTLRRLLNRIEADCVLDVGANVGQYGHELRRIGYRGRIVSFEPQPECFQILSQAAARDGNWQCFNVALGSRKEQRSFNVMASNDFSSFLDPSGESDWAEENTIAKVIDVPIATLDDILPELGTAFLKMDTQGFDLEVFRGARSLMDRIKGIQAEVAMRHLYQGVPPWHEVINEYRSAGFGLVAMHSVHPEYHPDALEFNCYLERIG